MDPRAKVFLFRLVVVGVTAVAISIGVGWGIALHQPNASSPDGLLKRVDDLA